MTLKDQWVLITGASQGIGAATAKRLGQEQARVILLARSEDKLQQVAQQVRQSGGQAHYFAVDLSDPQATEAVCRRILIEVGVPDIIINNAGAGRWLFVEETSAEEALQMTALPYLAAFYVCRCFMPSLLNRNSGMIVNVNSPISRVIWPGAVGYAAARWALRGFTQALRSDVSGTGLKVMEVVPAEVDNTYFINNPGAKERLPGIGRFFKVCTSEQTADFIVSALKRPKATAVMTRRMQALFWLMPFMDKLTHALVALTGYTYKKHARK